MTPGDRADWTPGVRVEVQRHPVGGIPVGSRGTVIDARWSAVDRGHLTPLARARLTVAWDEHGRRTHQLGEPPDPDSCPSPGGEVLTRMWAAAQGSIVVVEGEPDDTEPRQVAMFGGRA